MTSLLSQNAHGSALLAIFASAARVAVVRVFMLDPLRAYYQRQIEAATGLPIRAIQRELDRFTSISLLYRRVEGNRTYYQVDTQFPLFPELRNIILKAVSPEDRLRGLLAIDQSVRLLFLCIEEKRALVVTATGKRPALTSPGPFTLDVMSMDEFSAALTDPSKPLEPFLARGLDMLGRRENVIWRRIEAAGYTVQKGKGVP